MAKAKAIPVFAPANIECITNREYRNDVDIYLAYITAELTATNSEAQVEPAPVALAVNPRNSARRFHAAMQTTAGLYRL